MLAETNTGILSKVSKYWPLVLGIAVVVFLIFLIPKAFAAEAQFSNTYRNTPSGEVTVQFGNRGNLDSRGQRRFRDTDCEYNRNGRYYGHQRLQGFQNQHCRRDDQGYFRGHQRRFTPTQWDIDGDGVPNRRDSYPHNPRRD